MRNRHALHIGPRRVLISLPRRGLILGDAERGLHIGKPPLNHGLEVPLTHHHAGTHAHHHARAHHAIAHRAGAHHLSTHHANHRRFFRPVSYTHLTLPTIYSV